MFAVSIPNDITSLGWICQNSGLGGNLVSF